MLSLFSVQVSSHYVCLYGLRHFLSQVWEGGNLPAFNPNTHVHLLTALMPDLRICYLWSVCCSFSSDTRSPLGPGVVLCNVPLVLFKLENLLRLPLPLMALTILKSRVTPCSIFVVYCFFFLIVVVCFSFFLFCPFPINEIQVSNDLWNTSLVMACLPQDITSQYTAGPSLIIRDTNFDPLGQDACPISPLNTF